MRVAATGYTEQVAGPDDQVPPEEPGEPPQDWALRIETCRIELWRGYVMASFYARSADGMPGPAVAEPSTPFRWRKGAGADTEEARLAHYELISRLKSQGWTLTGQGDTWYATELALPVLVPSEELVLEEPAAEPVLEPVSRPVLVAVPKLEPAEPETRPVPRPRPRTRFNRWRFASATGLVGALVLLGWVVTHASTVGA